MVGGDGIQCRGIAACPFNDHERRSLSVSILHKINRTFSGLILDSFALLSQSGDFGLEQFPHPVAREIDLHQTDFELAGNLF